MINKRNQFSNINSTACNITYQTRLGSGSCSAWPRLRPNTKFTLSKQHPSPPTTNHKICPSRRVTFYTHHSGSCQASLRHANKRRPGLQIKTCPICRIYIPLATITNHSFHKGVIFYHPTCRLSLLP